MGTGYFFRAPALRRELRSQEKLPVPISPEDPVLSAVEQVAYARAMRLLLCLSLLLAAGCRDLVLLSGQSEGDANALLLRLEAHAIRGSKEIEGERYEVRVRSEDFSQALRIAQAEGFPRQRRPAKDESGALSLPSVLRERAELARAQADQIEEALLSVDGVVEARAIVAIGGAERAELDEMPVPTTASVLVRFRRSDSVLGAEAIQRFAAGAVHGLKSEQVQVMLVEAASLPPATAAVRSVVGVRVLESSVWALRGILGGAALAVVGLALACARLLMRVRRLTA